MPRITAFASALPIAALVVAAGCQARQESAATSDPHAAVASAVPVASDPVARGKYLTAITGCGDCHTPLMMGAAGPEPDMSRWLSGHPETMKLPPPPALDAAAPWNWSGTATLTAFSGPFGVTFAANLTPDSLTGLGIWTEDMFVRALREGKHMGTSRPIQPPMPWPWYKQMTDEDLKSIYAYLRTIPPIRNQVPDYVEPAAAMAH
jgi:mono/diheme cytochrome c family protein